VPEEEMSDVPEDFIEDVQTEVLSEIGETYAAPEKKKRTPRGLVHGYSPESHEAHITLDRWGDRPDEVSVVYPENSVIKSTGSNCYRVKKYMGQGVHAVDLVSGEYIGMKKYPPDILEPEKIWGLANNYCTLVVLGKEVLFTEKFDQFKTVVDDLLGELPEDIIQQFSQDPFYGRYQTVMMDGKTLPYKDRKEFVKRVDDLLGQLPEERIQKFVASRLFKLYQEVTDHYNLGGG